MNLSPDGGRYWTMAAGQNVPRPFVWRWFIPRVCGTRPAVWRAVAWLSGLLTACGVFVLADGGARGVAAAVMVAALPAARFNVTHPVLVDAPSMMFAVWAAVCADAHWWPAAIVLVCLSGMVKETGPVFAALYAWSPWLLVGLVPALLAMVVCSPGPEIPGLADDSEHAWILAHPWRAGQKYHHWLDPNLVAPWGGALAGFAALDVQLGVVLAVAYGQLLVATDTVRLYQWAAPLMCIAAAGVVPVAWLPLLVILTVWNPVAGNGV